MNIEYRDRLVRIWGIFLMLIFCTLIQREDIHRKYRRNKIQTNSRTIIILFYRHNKKRRPFFQQLYWLKIKAEYIRSTVSIANKYRIHQIIYTWKFLTIIQAKLLINQSNNHTINQPVQMADMNYVLIPFEGNIIHGDPTVIKLFLQQTKEIYK